MGSAIDIIASMHEYEFDFILFIIKIACTCTCKGYHSVPLYNNMSIAIYSYIHFITSATMSIVHIRGPSSAGLELGNQEALNCCVGTCMAVIVILNWECHNPYEIRDSLCSNSRNSLCGTSRCS